MGEFIGTPVKRYSSGMYVRLGFAALKIKSKLGYKYPVGFEEGLKRIADRLCRNINFLCS